MITGEDGILAKAQTAGEETTKGTEKEEIGFAYDTVLADNLENGNYTGGVTKDKLEAELGKKNSEAVVTGDGTDITVTYPTSKNEYKVNGKTGEITGPTNTQGQTPTPPSVEGKLATEVLKINTEASEDAQDYEKSPYVTYNGILCRVFYNDDYNDGKHGLQIISVDNIKKKDIQADGADEEEKVTLGDSSDFDKSMADYNEAVDTLNDKAKDCMSETDKQEDTVNKIAIDARSLGSIATLKNGKFQGDITEKHFDTTKYNYLSDYKEQFLDGDDNYIEDVGDDTGEKTGQLQKLGLNATSVTWLASRRISSTASWTGGILRFLNPDGSVTYDYRPLFGVGFSGYIVREGCSHSYGFRPVFLLSSDVKIISGNGTESTPYEFGI